ncbi:nitrous oxide-stimulated promoter family protein [Vibrio sp. JC009]|uniref:nitrous oxide-stimulated promoter family protein n=1 Tax=Vibrio sp. JC009 TaxID=2912314 RepID=UPI0023AF03C4|nr:nitrous oxide-stimulated promoter family protein [Vibrio sp. JC009]WED24433.1 nitrous oxide-stimulated promoter family protein [Vibrio sp. JC009]
MKESKILEGELVTEFKTLVAMMNIYCRNHHQTKVLCSECEELLNYAETKLDRCPYGQEKPACNKCPIHCYKPAEKEQMRAVMRYAGPRMLLRHPLLAIRHLRHEKMELPEKPLPNMSNRYIRLNRDKIT